MQQLWLVTVPNNKHKADSTYNAIQERITGGGNCRVFRFEMPSLVVGTLDTLMSLSDELNKINSQVENVVRKIERQYVDIKGASTENLKINEATVEAYLRRFKWDFARYQFQGKPLSELVSQIQTITSKADEELKQLATSFTEKTVLLGAVQRKKVVVLASSDFEDFLLPENVARLDLQNSDNLLTVMVAVPKALEADFLSNYSDIGSDIAAYGGPDWSKKTTLGQNDGKFGSAVSKKRVSVKGSPVVPGSKKKVAEEGDSVLYAITVLKGHYEAGSYVDETFVPGKYVEYLPVLKNAFREKKFVLREFSYDSTKSGGVDSQIVSAKEELKVAKTLTLRWCKANFGEVYSAWIHLKVIRAFVESVLRYGLPVDFLSFFLEPNLKKEKELKKSLTNTIESLRPELRLKKSLSVEEEEEEEAADMLSYICHKFPVIGASTTD